METIKEQRHLNSNQMVPKRLLSKNRHLHENHHGEDTLPLGLSSPRFFEYKKSSQVNLDKFCLYQTISLVNATSQMSLVSAGITNANNATRKLPLLLMRNELPKIKRKKESDSQ